MRIMRKNLNKLRDQCWKAAGTHIEHQDEIVTDLLANLGQQYANVKEMRWLQVAVANEMIDTMSTYADLDYFPDNYRPSR